MSDVIQNRYTLLEQIGSGGMSTVWLAEDSVLQRRVALKILHKHLDPSLGDRLRREAALLARLENPFIVPVFESGETEDGRPFIAMKYIPGNTLDKLLPLPVAEIRAIFSQILEGLAAAHEIGIIHRDIKPSNILLGNDGRAYLLDFGVAKDKSSQDDITETGTVIGTAHYLSPEQAHGEEATEQSDLYSLGIALYESLTGHQPWPGRNSLSLAVQQAMEPAEPPSKSRKDVDSRLDRTVLRAIAYKPSLRFQSAREFQSALQDSRPLRRWKVLWLLPLLLLAGAFFIWQQGKREVPPLQGLSLLEARERLSEENLRWQSRLVWNESPRGTVTGTSPAEGAGIRSGDTVTLLVSRGPRLFLVPEVRGKTLSLAEDLLQEAGLRSKVRRIFSSEPRGIVIRSDPEEEVGLRQRSEVLLWVSRGPTPIRAPDCVGTSEEECLTFAEDLQVVTEYWGSALPAGEVIDQFPSPGKTTETLQIYVSRGESVVAIPSLEGERIGRARNILRRLGLGVVVSREESEEMPGVVLRQSPGSGEEVSPGEEVTLVVAYSGQN